MCDPFCAYFKNQEKEFNYEAQAKEDEARQEEEEDLRDELAEAEDRVRKGKLKPSALKRYL